VRNDGAKDEGTRQKRDSLCFHLRAERNRFEEERDSRLTKKKTGGISGGLVRGAVARIQRARNRGDGPINF